MISQEKLVRFSSFGVKAGFREYKCISPAGSSPFGTEEKAKKVSSGFQQR
jgi:hypothetical protein